MDGRIRGSSVGQEGVLSQDGWMEMEHSDWWSPSYMTLSKMMTLLSSVPGDKDVRDLMSGAMYSM